MHQCDTRVVRQQGIAPKTGFERFLRWLAAFTMLMTVPQVLTVWRAGATGVSLASWVAYLASSIAWLVYGVRRRDATIWMVCIGWIVVDGAIIVGILVQR